MLAHLDQGTGLPVRKNKAVRYEKSKPGELVHGDIKKLGRIPDGDGHRILGRQIGARNNNKHGRGYACLHHAVADHSRLAYSEILSDKQKATAAAFWKRARAFFTEGGIQISAVMTDNGSCYRSHAFADALDGIRAGCTTTTITARTQESEATSPRLAFAMSRGKTASPFPGGLSGSDSVLPARHPHCRRRQEGSQVPPRGVWPRVCGQPASVAGVQRPSQRLQVRHR